MAYQYTLSEMSKKVCMEPLAVSCIQKALQLPILDDGYSESYMYLVMKVAAMRSLRIAMDRISDLLETEKKILRLLHFESTEDSPAWYMEGCNGINGQSSNSKQSLLLTGFDLGFAIDGDAVQENLNFGKTETELFAGVEMGEDVRRLLGKYRDMHKSIKKQLKTEKASLEQAIKWAKRVLRE